MAKKVAPSKKHRPVIRRVKVIIASVIALAIIVAVVFIALPHGPNRAINREVTQALDNSQVGKTVDDIVRQQQLVSIMATPASATWWQRLHRYVYGFNFQKIPYTAIGNATSLGWIALNNHETEDMNYIGNAALFVTYNTVAQAKQAEQRVNTALADSGTTYAVNQVGNNIVLLRTGTSTAEMFTLKNYKPAQQAEPLTKAYWHINWTTLGRYGTTVQDAYYEKIAKQVLQLGGVDTTLKNAYWDGTSTDGVHWVGENNSDSDDPVVNPAKMQPRKIFDALDGTERTIRFVAPDGTESDFGITEERQSAIEYYLGISTKNVAVGSVSDDQKGTSVAVKKLSADATGVKVSVNPNAWFQYMYRNESDLFPTFGFQLVTFELQPGNNSMNLTFSAPLKDVN